MASRTKFLAEMPINGKLAFIRELKAKSPPLRRGDDVLVVPTRGDIERGILIDVVPTDHYGVWYDILIGGRVVRIEDERVSQWIQQ